MSAIQSTVKDSLDVAERQVRSGLKVAEETTTTAATRLAETVRPFVPAPAMRVVDRVRDPELVVGKAYGLANDVLSANRRYVEDVTRALSKLTSGKSRSTARRTKPRPKAS